MFILIERRKQNNSKQKNARDFSQASPPKKTNRVKVKIPVRHLQISNPGVHFGHEIFHKNVSYSRKYVQSHFQRR